MRDLELNAEILMSWKRCTACGLASTILSPVQSLEIIGLEGKQKENTLLLSIFGKYAEKAGSLITDVYCLFLVDSAGILLKKTVSYVI